MSALTRFAARDITVRRLRLSCSVAGGHRSQQAGGHGPAAVACVEMPLDRRPNRSRRKIPAGAGVPLRPQALNVVLDLATTVSTARCLTASLAWPQRNQDSRENSPLFRSDLVISGYSIGDPCDGRAVSDELPLSDLANIQGQPVQLRTDRRQRQIEDVVRRARLQPGAKTCTSWGVVAEMLAHRDLNDGGALPRRDATVRPRKPCERSELDQRDGFGRVAGDTQVRQKIAVNDSGGLRQRPLTAAKIPFWQGTPAGGHVRPHARCRRATATNGL
jgi:hypothetical protein